MNVEGGVFIVGLFFLLYSVLAVEGHSPGGRPIAIITACVGVYLVQFLFRLLWRERDIFGLAAMLGVLSFLGYAFAQSYFS